MPPKDLPWSAPSVCAVKIGLLLVMWYSSSVVTSLTAAAVKPKVLVVEPVGVAVVKAAFTRRTRRRFG